MSEQQSQKILINGSYGGYWLSDAIVEYCKERGFSPNQFGRPEEERANPILIEAVEKLGHNGKYGDLVIIEVPPCVEWQICEYDGLEWVAEKHRIWGSEP